MIHLGPAFGGSPIRIVFQQFDIEPIEPGRGADVKGAIAHLLDGADARQGQEEAEMVGEVGIGAGNGFRSEEHTSELQSLMRISYAVFCLKKKKKKNSTNTTRR